MAHTVDIGRSSTWGGLELTDLSLHKWSCNSPKIAADVTNANIRHILIDFRRQE